MKLIGLQSSIWLGNIRTLCFWVLLNISSSMGMSQSIKCLVSNYTFATSRQMCIHNKVTRGKKEGKVQVKKGRRASHHPHTKHRSLFATSVRDFVLNLASDQPTLGELSKKFTIKRLHFQHSAIQSSVMTTQAFISSRFTFTRHTFSPSLQYLDRFNNTSHSY